VVTGKDCAAADPTRKAKPSLLPSVKEGVSIVAMSFVCNEKCGRVLNLQHADQGPLYYTPEAYHVKMSTTDF
jgi:hypothetical protein